MSKTQLQLSIAVLVVSWFISSMLGAAFIGGFCAIAAILAIFQLTRYDAGGAPVEQRAEPIVTETDAKTAA